MRHSTSTLSLLFWSAMVLVATKQVDAATTVEIVIDETYQNRSVPWPVTTGVPFPRGALSDSENCRLVDDTGAEQMLQSKVNATWDRQRTSIRWLTIDFIAHPGRKYSLEFGPDVKRAKVASPLRIARGQSPMVSTGVMKSSFSRDGASSLAGFYLDLNGDKRVASEELVASGSRRGEHYFIDQNDRSFSSDRDGIDREITVESEGPVRACVRVDGFYTGPKGERIVRYRTRYHFFAGLSLVKVIDEFKIVGSTQKTRFRDIGFALKLAGKTKRRTVAIDASGEAGNQVVSVPWQDDTNSVSSVQSTYRHYGNLECEAAIVEANSAGEKTIKQTDRVGEWMQVGDGRATITGSLRWFWQQFPKQWETTNDELVLHLWSPRAGQLDFGARGIEKFLGSAGKKYLAEWAKGPRPSRPLSYNFYFAGRDQIERGEADGQGINKHHEFFLHFGTAKQTKIGAEYGQLAAKQPLALASGEWNCSTDVFGPLMPRGVKQHESVAKYEAIVDKIFDLGRYGQDTFGDYGWWLFGAGPHYSYQWDAETKRHYADSRRFEFHTYQKETQLWWNYLRSGERKFYDWAIPSENHWVDIAVAHVPLEIQCDWLGGQPVKRRKLHWRPGDWAIDNPYHYVRHHDTAEAWLRGGAQFWASYHRTLETTTLAYYLTGDERFNDVIEFWKNYWGELAGKTSASEDVKPWHREQAWFRPTGPDEPRKTWAEMIRDYAPFTSGSRHQMTLFFSLATLYEHTWDPKIGQVLEEYADAFLDPDHPIGVWRCQENSLPSNAEAPTMAHFWVPALWKYGRATNDPRMKQIFKRFFDTAYAADPLGETHDVGRYSDLHHGYAYYFTCDPRHLTLAEIELENLLPNARPLARPEEINQRLYNPYAPIRSFAAVPRLLWALDNARRDKVVIPPRPRLSPQRTAIAIHKERGQKITATLWGFDRELKLIGPDSEIAGNVDVQTKQYVSHRQPFDRALPNFEVYLHQLTIPAKSPAGHYILSPKLELGIVSMQGADEILCNASNPVLLPANGQCWLPVAGGRKQLQIETAAPSSIQVIDENESAIGKQATNTIATFKLPDASKANVYRIENASSRPLWYRIVDSPVEQCWVSLQKLANAAVPSREQTSTAVSGPTAHDPDDTYVQGRFGKAVQITPERTLSIPDHVLVDGKTVRLFDVKQGTIEFWVKRQWDARLKTVRRVTHVSNGLLQAWSPESLPLNEWAQVAVVWRPFKRDPSRTCVHIYVNGRDRANYRNTWWPGYGSRSPSFPSNAKWLKQFVIKAPPQAAFAIDELRISSVPRYANLDIEFGPQQTFNPIHFEPDKKGSLRDDQTYLLFRFDGNLKDSAKWRNQSIEGTLSVKP